MRGRISRGRGVVVVVGAAQVVYYTCIMYMGCWLVLVLSCNGRPLGAQDQTVPQYSKS